MGYIDPTTHAFVSEETPAGLAVIKRAALALANTHFSSVVLESFDLGNLIGGYMTAEIRTCAAKGQRRIIYFLDKSEVYTQRYDAGQGGRTIAWNYFVRLLTIEKERAQLRSQLKPLGVKV